MPAPDPNRRLAIFAVALAVILGTSLLVAATDVFTDVPTSNIFHDDIAWLADAGITKGCNPPDNTEFCPAEEVTRQQMAAFMRRLAESEVVSAATAREAEVAKYADEAGYSHATESAYNSRYVGGFAPDNLLTKAAFTSKDDLPDEDGSISIELSAPEPDGFIILNAAVDISGGDAEVTCSLEVNGSVVRGTRMTVTLGPEIP
jgi:hypothetical protein